MVIESCITNKDKLNNVGLHLGTLRKLVRERKENDKIERYMSLIDAELTQIGESIIDIDETIGNLSITLNELKEEGKRIVTSVVIDHTTGEMNLSRSYDVLLRRYNLFSKKLEYYCHQHAVLVHQIEAQRLANDMRGMGFEPIEFEDTDIDTKRKATRLGPRINKLLDDFVNKSK